MNEDVTSLNRRINQLTEQLRRVENQSRQAWAYPTSFGSVSAPQYPWVALLVKGGQTPITTPASVYGIKRKTGEAKPTGWIYAQRRATATCALGSGGTAGKVVGATIVDCGSAYVSAPAVTVGAPPSGGTQAVITAAVVDNYEVVGVYITACGSGYIQAPGITFAAAPGGGVTAQGYCTLRDGKVVAILVTNRGKGYTSAPAITITPAVGETPTTTAAATAVTGKGVIVTLTVTNQGAGYVTAPTIAIAAHPVAQPYPMPPSPASDAPPQWADGVGWGMITTGSLTGGLAGGLAVLICHDDRSLIPYGLMGDGGGSVPLSRPPDAVLTWYKTMMKLSIADADADGVIEAWVPMSGGA